MIMTQFFLKPLAALSIDTTAFQDALMLSEDGKNKAILCS